MIKSTKSRRNPLGNWASRMREKTHVAKNVYRRPAERRENDVDWQDEIENLSDDADYLMEC